MPGPWLAAPPYAPYPHAPPPLEADASPPDERLPAAPAPPAAPPAESAGVEALRRELDELKRSLQADRDAAAPRRRKAAAPKRR
jgi:hypothetical protein